MFSGWWRTTDRVTIYILW